MMRENGEDQVHQWRRSYDVRPPRSEEQREAYLKIVVINILITV